MKRKTNPDASKDILVVIPKQKTESLIWDRKFAHLVAFFSIPYTIAFLKFCRKLGMELSLDKTSGICIPGKNGSKRLDPNTNPCLTALTLATILDFNKFSFSMIDPPLGFPRSSKNELKKQLRLKPKILAISTTFVVSTLDIKSIIKLSKKISPGTKILIGGQYLLTSKKSMEELEGADLFVLGECEDNLAPVVRALINNDSQAVQKIRGIVYRKGKQLIHTPPSPPVDLEKTLFINWSLMKNFYPIRDGNTGYIFIEDGRGCSFTCSYCSFRNNFFFRLKSIERIVHELKKIPEHFKDVHIFFISSTFTFPEKRAMEICCRIIEEKLIYKYMAYARVSDINEGLVEKLRSANFYCLFFGLESMDEKVLKAANKRTNSTQIENAISLTHEAGIFTDCSFVIGLPKETRESVKKIEEFVQKACVDRYCLFPLSDHDTSDLAAEPEKYQFERKDYMNWAHADLSSKDVPRLMADILISGYKTSHAYSSMITDTLNGNNISALHVTSVLPQDLKSLYILTEKGTVMYLQRHFRGTKIDRSQLKLILAELKNKYLPQIKVLKYSVEFVKISLKIFALKLIIIKLKLLARGREKSFVSAC